MKWENTTNEDLLVEARNEIWKSWRDTCADNKDHPRAAELFNPDKLPAFHDPFAGGGALPLEAQRLGLESYASDLNPVAVLINKAMIEIPPKFAGRPPVNPESRGGMALEGGWKGAKGLAEDVRYYGKWMRDEAEKRIGHLYPKIEITADMAEERPDLKPLVGRNLTVIAWLWARTVKSPNPAFAQVDVPLASTFMLSTKAGKEAYVEPVIENGGYRFAVKVGKPKDAVAAKNGTKSGGSHSAFFCLMSGTPMPFDYIRGQGKAGRMGVRLMAIVAEGIRGRVYLSHSDDMENVARQAHPEWKPDCEMPKKHRNFQPPVYGMNNLGDIFTSRQLVALTTFSDLVQETRERVKYDALCAGMPDSFSLNTGGIGATAYADSVAVYMAFAVDKGSNYWSSLCSWHSGRDTVTSTFGRQALPMVWDFAEANPFSESSGNYLAGIDQAKRQLLFAPAAISGCAYQADAAVQSISEDKVISTDPPYYDNICYADLSDFFYVWLRRSLKSVFPNLFSTLAVPKTEELIATAYRHGSKEKAEEFFLDGMTRAMHRLAIRYILHFRLPSTMPSNSRKTMIIQVYQVQVGRHFSMQ